MADEVADAPAGAPTGESAGASAGAPAGESAGQSSDELPDEGTLSTIETQVAMLMRLGEATRRSTGLRPHRALDRAAYVILRHLGASGPQNVTVLADRLNLDGSTVTRQVTALEKNGLAVRRPDPNDGRGTVIEPTAAGLRQADNVARARRVLYDRILAGWSEDDRRQLAATLERFNASVETYMHAADR